MSDLFQLVRDHVEATDQITQEWQTADGPRTLTRSFSRPVAWIENVHERGVLTALDCLSIIFFALDDWHALPTREQEIQLAEGWAAELRQAAHAGEIQARDPFTLLPLTNTPEGWDWGLSTSDADRFLAARGMSWRCGEIASHIYNEVASEIEAKRFPPFLDKSAHSTAAPVEADSASDAPDWTVSKPQRYNGYTAPLHRLLAAAHRDGNPCPTARDVVEAWRNNAPAEIAKVLPDGFDYYDAKGNTKTADLEAIRKAIGRMTIAR